jgi:hypothetical protein
VYSYLLHGLRVRSSIGLAGAAEQNCYNDIEDVKIVVSRPRRGCGFWRTRLDLFKAEATFSLAGVARFIVRDGREVIVQPSPGCPPAQIRRYLTGTVMSIVLWQRGYLVLHSSSIIMDGACVAFAGESGHGKSTTAAVLWRMGHAVVADDLTAIDLAHGEPSVPNTSTTLKLFPAAAHAAGVANGALHRLASEEPKFGVTCQNGKAPGSAPLSAIYFLDRNAAEPVQRLKPQQALLELIRHSFPTRLCHPGEERHFLQCADLARQVAMFRLRPFTAFEHLKAWAEFVEMHVAESIGTPVEA